MTQITVRKLHPSGDLSWQYEGRLLRRDRHSVVLEAFFDRLDTRVLDIVLRSGDRFVETYYDLRWYNTMEVHDREDDTLKGWYCNISRPAVFEGAVVSWVDLALDLWVWPDGRQAVLDDDEFRALSLGRAEQDQALAALDELRSRLKRRRPPP